MWPFKKRENSVNIMQGIICGHTENNLAMCKRLQNKLNEYCDKVIKFNDKTQEFNGNPQLYFLYGTKKMVMGSIEYDPNDNTMSLLITGGSIPVSWKGSVERFLAAPEVPQLEYL